MKTLTFAALSLGLVSLASASDTIVVECGRTGFSDLTKVEIRETDLKGQYQIVETLFDVGTKKNSTRLSPVFNHEELERGVFPNLTMWNGYDRRLVRYGRDNYAIELRDECSGSTTSIDCKDRF